MSTVTDSKSDKFVHQWQQNWQEKGQEGKMTHKAKWVKEGKWENGGFKLD